MRIRIIQPSRFLKRQVTLHPDDAASRADALKARREARAKLIASMDPEWREKLIARFAAADAKEAEFLPGPKERRA